MNLSDTLLKRSKGELKVADSDLSSLANNLIVVEILEAARNSAAAGKTIKLQLTCNYYL